MSMKMFKMSAVALVAALLFPSATFASGWDYLGEQSLFTNGAESDQSTVPSLFSTVFAIALIVLTE